MEFMSVIIYIVIVSIFSIAISPVLNGFIEKFVKEDKNIEEFEKTLIEDIQSGKITKKQSEKIIKEKSKSLKEKLEPKFSVTVTLVTLLLSVFLLILKIAMNDFSIFNYLIMEFLLLLLIIDMFADIKGYIIPNETNFVGFIVGLIYAFYNLMINLKVGVDLILGGMFGFLVFLLIAGIAMLLYKKEGMGGGDIKLMAVIGLFMGLYNTIQIFIFSFFIAAIIGIFLIVTKKKTTKDYIPFGPFIVVATYITMIIPAITTFNLILDIVPIYHY